MKAIQVSVGSKGIAKVKVSNKQFRSIVLQPATNLISRPCLFTVKEDVNQMQCHCYNSAIVVVNVGQRSQSSLPIDVSAKSMKRFRKSQKM